MRSTKNDSRSTKSVDLDSGKRRIVYLNPESRSTIQVDETIIDLLKYCLIATLIATLVETFIPERFRVLIRVSIRVEIRNPELQPEGPKIHNPWVFSMVAIRVANRVLIAISQP